MPINLEQDADGRTVATKYASTPDAMDRVRREAQALAAASHPGIVELLDVSFDGDLATLRMAAAPGADLARRTDPLPAAEVAGLVAAVATTVSDLHLMGFVHGAIAAEHVMVGSDGAPVLCGFGDSRPIEEAEPSTDVAALGQLANDLLDPAERSPAAEVMRALATWATTPDPDGRPSAAELAARIEERISDARLPGPSAPPSRRASRPARRLQVARPAAVLVIGLLAIATWHVSRPSEAATTEVAASAASTRPTPTSSTTTSSRRPAAPALVWPPQPASCSPACDAAVLADGIIESAGARYRVGQPGDLAAVAPWSCTEATVVLVRPSTGEVWAFDTWAQPDRPAPARPLTVVEGAQALQAADVDGDRCLEAVVLGASGPEAIEVRT